MRPRRTHRTAPAPLVLDLRCLQDDNRFHGIGTYARAVVAYLQREGPRLGLAVEGAWYDEWGRLQTRPLGTLDVARLPRGGHVERVFLHPAVRRRYSGLWFARLARRGAVVHFMDQNNCPYSFAGTAVLTVHDVVPALAGEWIAKPRHLEVERAYFRRVLGWAGPIVTVSEFSRQEVIRHFAVAPERIRVVTPPVAAAPAAPRARRRPQLLYVGGLDARKNVGRLLEAFCRFKERQKGPHRLVVAGAGRAEDRAGLRRRFAHRPGWAAVDFLGFVAAERLDALMRESAALVFVTLYEGFGYPVVEAMARGLPVICSRGGSLPEVAGEAAVLVDAHDPDAVAAAMARVVTDGRLAGALRRRGRARAARFCGEGPLERLVDCYRAALAAPRRPGRA